MKSKERKVGVLFLRSNPVDPDPRVEKEALSLARAGYTVRVLAWDRTASLPKRLEKEYGLLERVSIPGRFGAGLANLKNLLRFQLALIIHLWRNRHAYDIVHACDFDTVLPALLSKFFFGKRVVYDIFDFYVPAVRRFELWVARLADAVILPDESRKVLLGGYQPKRLAFIYNSPHIEGARFPVLPPPIPPLRIGYVGILVKERGFDTMFQVLEKHPDWILDIAGFGRDEQEIVNRVAHLSNVFFHGRVPYLEGLKIAASSHILFATYDPAIPNHRFSSANKLFEAMALGRPIIVARGTGMDRIVDKYGLGFVVDYGDVKQLEAVLHEVQNWNGEKWKEFSERARATFNELFSWEIQEHRLVALYHELASCFPWVRTG